MVDSAATRPDVGARFHLCGQSIADADRFCENCGAAVTPRLEAAEPPSLDGAPDTCVKCGGTDVTSERYCMRCGHLQPLIPDRIEVDIGVAAGVSDRGTRHRRNEDAMVLRRAAPCEDAAGCAVVVVCDGVSSAENPDQAALRAAESGADTIAAALGADLSAERATREAVVAAMDAVIALGHLSGGGRSAPACTYVSAVVGAGWATVGWVGDSRAYWVPDDRSPAGALRLTKDDSWMAQHDSGMAHHDSWMAQRAQSRDSNEIKVGRDWRAHAITAWLGADADDVNPHIVTHEASGPGVVVVCTDGLWNYLDGAEQLAGALPPDATSAPLDAARQLVRVALDAGGHDNVTVAVMPLFPDRSEGAP